METRGLKSKIGVFDIESERWLHLRAIGFFDGIEYRLFIPDGKPNDKHTGGAQCACTRCVCVRKFLSVIDSRKYRGWRFYAHNGGRFDDLFLLEELMRRQWTLRFIERSGKIIAIYVTTKKTQFTIADSHALLPAPLKELGEAFNVDHKKKEYEFPNDGRIDPHDRTLQDYLRNDCLCLYEVLKKFFDLPYIGQPQLTIASQALNTFREYFLDGELQRVTLEEEEIFRKLFYAGGRVEVFKGQGTVHCYDVNSLYPYVMLNEMPCGKLKETRTFDPHRIGFYEVDIHSTPAWYCSPLLLKVPSGQSHQNYFVNGKGTYYCSSDTLLYLKKEWGIRFSVRWGYVFQNREPLFDSYVNTWYKIKKENKGNALGIVSKFMLNALYGKLGQTRWRESLEKIPINKRSGLQWTEWEGDTTYGLILVKRESKSKFILPYLAAYITDLARLHLAQLLLQHPDEAFYCDTDSVYTSAQYPHGTDIGQLDYKGQFDGIFLAPKSYALKINSSYWKKHPSMHNAMLKFLGGAKERITFKGFQPDHFCYDDFEEALHNQQQLSMQEKRILSFREALQVEKMREEGKTTRKKFVLEAGKFLKQVHITKKVESPYDRRKIIPSKKYVFDTMPYTYSELITRIESD